MTSVSQRKPVANSLTTVLEQALQSADDDQLSWIMKQTEQPLLQHTIKALKPDYVGKLFTQILH